MSAGVFREYMAQTSHTRKYARAIKSWYAMNFMRGVFEENGGGGSFEKGSCFHPMPRWLDSRSSAHLSFSRVLGKDEDGTFWPSWKSWVCGSVRRMKSKAVATKGVIEEPMDRSIDALPVVV